MVINTNKSLDSILYKVHLIPASIKYKNNFFEEIKKGSKYFLFDENPLQVHPIPASSK